MKKWLAEEIDVCINLLKMGKTYKEIGFITERDYRSIRGKLNKLGLKYIDFKLKIKTEIKECLNCNIKFNSLVSEKRKFCSHKCSATYNNKLKIKHNRCLNCNKETKNKKFCSRTCNTIYNKTLQFNSIENGNITLDHRRYKEYLIFKFGEQCMKCGWNEKNLITNKIPIELEHIDGHSENNRLENLMLLCPNCHSLTPTYKALNVGNGRNIRRIRYNG